MPGGETPLDPILGSLQLRLLPLAPGLTVLGSRFAGVASMELSFRGCWNESDHRLCHEHGDEGLDTRQSENASARSVVRGGRSAGSGSLSGHAGVLAHPMVDVSKQSVC